MKIYQYLRLHMKINCWRFHFKTSFTFWGMCTWDIWKVCLQTLRNNMLKISLIFKTLTNFTDKFGNFYDEECKIFRILLLYEHKTIWRFLNLHQCTFNLSLVLSLYLSFAMQKQETPVLESLFKACVRYFFVKFLFLNKW